MSVIQPYKNSGTMYDEAKIQKISNNIKIHSIVQTQNFAFHFYTRNFPILQKITMFATLKKIQ